MSKVLLFLLFTTKSFSAGSDSNSDSSKVKSDYDSRSSIITLTPAGKIVYKKIINMMQNEINHILLKINVDDID